MKHLKLLSTLVMSGYLPTLNQTIEIVHLDWSVTEVGRVIISNSDVVTYNPTDGSQTKTPIKNVRAIRYTNTVQYPELPPAFKPPPKSDPLAWSVICVRAMLHRVNTESTRLWECSLVTAIELDHSCKCLRVVMSRLWERLGVHVRHEFLNELWSRYHSCLTRLKADRKYAQIALYDGVHQEYPIGIRTESRAKVFGGPLVLYKHKP
jgi:hypothetical protein